MWRARMPLQMALSTGGLGGGSAAEMKWIDRVLAARARTWALVVVLLGLVVGCIEVGSLLATGAFAGEPLSFTVPLLGLCFAGVLVPCLFFGLICLLQDATVKRRGQFWYLFRSAVVKDICEHLTDAEKVRFRRIGAAYGVPLGLLAGLLAAGWSYGFAEAFLPPPVVTVPVGVLAFAGVALQGWRHCRRFLSSTQYAQERGLESRDIHMRQWPKKSP